MITVAALCAVAGLVLGLGSNVRMFILVVMLITFAAFIAGLSQGGGLPALGWGFIALIVTQVGYILMVILRAAWAAAQARYRQPVPY